MTDATCPWCSAALPTPTPEHCPSCNASLVPTATEDVPGVTQIDLAAVTRGNPIVEPPKRSLLGFISGEYQVDEAAAPAGSLSPPPDAVRREMLRMEIEAAEHEAAAIQAELEIEAAEAAREAAEAAEAAEAEQAESADSAAAASEAAVSAADASEDAAKES